jgi:hypothetical protein
MDVFTSDVIKSLRTVIKSDVMHSPHIFSLQKGASLPIQPEVLAENRQPFMPTWTS